MANSTATAVSGADGNEGEEQRIRRLDIYMETAWRMGQKRPPVVDAFPGVLSRIRGVRLRIWWRFISSVLVFALT